MNKPWQEDDGYVPLSSVPVELSIRHSHSKEACLVLRITCVVRRQCGGQGRSRSGGLVLHRQGLGRRRGVALHRQGRLARRLTAWWWLRLDDPPQAVQHQRKRVTGWGGPAGGCGPGLGEAERHPHGPLERAIQSQHSPHKEECAGGDERGGEAQACVAECPHERVHAEHAEGQGAPQALQ